MKKSSNSFILRDKVIIFANGICENPDGNLKYIAPGDFIICADGGTEYALQLGLTPDLVIGDLDSISAQTLQAVREKGVEIRRYPQAKDQTDLELALGEGLRHAAKEILILSAFGGRVDQFLANIFLLVRYHSKGIRLSIADGNQRMWLLQGPDEITLPGDAGDTFSLIPLSAKVSGVDLSGLEWPLENAVLEMGTTQAVSNKFKLRRVNVKIKSGTALAIHGI
ncbi:MAG: thiamine diphosphokinase [Calditrichaeota bacterium]|nr:thiamine diphosphokinase [Calditrichota bacterium]